MFLYFIIVQSINQAICISMPEWRNGRRTGLKILRRQLRAGSSPASGTKNSIFLYFLKSFEYNIQSFFDLN